MNKIENEKNKPTGEKGIHDPTQFIDESFSDPKSR